MTKTITLTYNPNTDCWDVPSATSFSNEGEEGKKKTHKRAICADFINSFSGINNPQDLKDIKLIVSTEPLTDALHIKVRKGGYYRWTWRFITINAQIISHPVMQGMRIDTEDQMNGFFPDASDDGNEEEKDLFLKFSQ